MKLFGLVDQIARPRTSQPPWTPPDAWAPSGNHAGRATVSARTGTRNRPPRILGISPILIGGTAASLVAAALVIALVVALGASAPRSGTPTRAPAPFQATLTAASPGTSGLLNLGGVTVGLDSSSVDIEPTLPGGPQLKPDIAVDAEPGAAVDGLVVPLVGGLTKGTGQVAVHTPTIGSLKSIGVNVGGGGRITVTVHPFEGIP